jgi:hypothetical protein
MPPPTGTGCCMARYTATTGRRQHDHHGAAGNEPCATTPDSYGAVIDSGQVTAGSTAPAAHFATTVWRIISGLAQGRCRTARMLDWQSLNTTPTAYVLEQE